MSNQTIDQLTAGAAPDGTENVPVRQGGVTKRLTSAQIAAAGAPKAHKVTHAAGGTDALDLSTLAGTLGTTQYGNQTVTYGKIQNVSASGRLLGRSTAGAGSVEEISLGGGLTLSGGVLSAPGGGSFDPATTAYATTGHTVQSPTVLRFLDKVDAQADWGAKGDGITDDTVALNNFFTDVIANKKRGRIRGGEYKTTGELIASGTNGLWVEGDGPGLTRIRPQGTTYHGLRINLGEQFRSAGRVEGLSVVGPSSTLPTGGKAGFILDHTTLLVVSDIDVQYEDIGFDLINNCYNCKFYNLCVPRFNSCNVGLNLRTGSQSGSDLHFFDTHFDCQKCAVSISGGGGGYGFTGGQWSVGWGGAATDYGVLMLGYDWATQAEVGGCYSNRIERINFEGMRGCHVIRAFGEVTASVRDCSFNATAATAGQLAQYLLKHTDAQTSKWVFDNNGIGQSNWNFAQLMYLAGTNDDFIIAEQAWRSASGSVVAGGAPTGGDWMKSLQHFGWTNGTTTSQFVHGHAHYSIGKYKTLGQGNGRLRVDYASGVWQKSSDAGATWTNV